ncbi:MAG TPA: succinate dehydrogenase cytochrome b subunit [Desulfobacteraceae bacterium]|nr:succinate dehydrogenase cytochrome b subunit [Deltaproteobacteria bacterium]RLB99151.1 MAG: succinate dehydrogenase [Deltaproteobacteria bacterium]HDI61120.1 succinate dehydrogenase cytochrome b subunit [Desulfobacteraceae bacterium]
MNWLTATFGTAIGKKLFMSLTGLIFCLFLVGHLAGNLLLLAGADTFNAYAAHLQGLGPLLRVMEAGLVFFALVHVATGLLLFYQNQRARPVRYRVNASGGGQTLGSATMPYTGVLILGFLLFHLVQFTFTAKGEGGVYALVAAAFSQPFYVGLYILAMVVVAVHVSHGFWSAFQTLGLNHGKYFGFLRAASVVLAVVLGAGFGFLPVFVGWMV